MKKIYITGVCGFIGSNLANHFYKKGWEVHGCDNLHFGTIKNLIDLGIYDKINFTLDDFVNTINLTDCDVVIHTATSNIIYGQNHRLETIENNFKKLLNFPKNKRYIYLSTSSVYGQSDILPTPEDAPIKLSSIYAETKWLAEEIFKGNVIFRLSNVYGVNQRNENPYCGVIGKFIESYLNNQPLNIISDGKQTRDFTYIEDVCNAIEIAVNNPNITGTYNIGTGVETSITQLANIISKETKINWVEKRNIDNIDRRCLNISKIQSLGWKPTTNINEGIKKTINWYRTI